MSTLINIQKHLSVCYFVRLVKNITWILKILLFKLGDSVNNNDSAIEEPYYNFF